MTEKDHLFWRKNDFSINRAPAPLAETQKGRAEDTLREASGLIPEQKKKRPTK